jgi:phosphatidylserine decarboxylase
MKNTLFIFFQYIIPQKLLSRFAGCVAEYSAPWFKNRLIHWFIKRYNVDMSIAENSSPSSYKHFNDFFIRPLAEGQRPIDDAQDSIVCPADGCISQLGKIKDGRVFQAKEQDYSLQELIGGSEALAIPFKNGQFATVYLSPKDYHRVHMPIAGTLRQMLHVPGDLFSVNETTANSVPRLFGRNERVVCLFDTELGSMAVILVGAMIVASIETPWAGLITPLKKQVRSWSYPSINNPSIKSPSGKIDSIDTTPFSPIQLQKGEEMGRFKLGSTAIILFGDNVMDWDENLKAQSSVMMGQAMGKFNG